jgi:Ca2+:H+ antiporter
MKTWLRVLPWLAAPAALISRAAGAPPTVIFLLAGVGLLPLAGLMGRATEHLAARLGSGVGGLLNASFGNAAELLIAFMALRRGMTSVVKASITGSIVGNSLLVLGLSIFVGGLRHERQRFNTTAARLGATLLALSAAALILPATFHHVAPADQGAALAQLLEGRLSVGICGILIVSYVASLLFSLKTHKHLYAGEGHEEFEGTPWPIRRALTFLTLSTVGVGVLSEVLVAEVEHVSKVYGLTEVFVGVMVVAILGNAAEHSTAILMAAHNRMDLALQISVGSSTQIALFVAPILVFASLFLGHRLDLVFTPAEVVAVSLSAWVVSLVSNDGESNWMEGLLLLCVYAVLGVTFYFLPA